jgi:predicted ABC-type ATPase
MRMFAGPNGSGKSTLKTVLPSELIGYYINPDDIEKELRATSSLNLKAYGVTTTTDEALAFFKNSSLLQLSGLADATRHISLQKNALTLTDIEVNSYFASAVADFLRREMLRNGLSFTFETVMSSPDKVAFLKTARGQGYRTCLYYIATDDPEINISRVRNRVSQGGHPVPEDKIVSRYERSLNFLMDAIRNTNRAYVFDNSGNNQERVFLAEITDGKILEMKTDSMPAWFKRAVWDKITP